jgi:hypothetical protein
MELHFEDLVPIPEREPEHDSPYDRQNEGAQTGDFAIARLNVAPNALDGRLTDEVDGCCTVQYTTSWHKVITCPGVENGYVFNKPTPFTIDKVFFIVANGSSLMAEVFIKSVNAFFGNDNVFPKVDNILLRLDGVRISALLHPVRVFRR